MTTKLIEIAKLKQHPFQSTIYNANSSATEQLADTIKQFGVIQPLRINRNYEVMSGNRRLEAAIAVGLTEVPVIFVDIPKEEEEQFILDSNLMRKRSLLEVVREIKKYYKIYERKPGRKPKNNGDNPDTISGRTKEIVSRLVGLCSTYVDSLNKLDLKNKTVVDYLKQVDSDDATINAALEAIGRVCRINAAKKNLNMVSNSGRTITKAVISSKSNDNSGGKIIKLNQASELTWEKPFKVFNESCANLDKLPKRSVNMSFTSPPYFGLRDYDGDSNQLGQEKDYRDYIRNLCELLMKLYDVLTDDGSFYLNIGDTRRDGFQLNIPQQVVQCLIESGWKLANTIIWHKTNPKIIPGAPVQPTYEFLYQLVKDRGYYDNIITVPTKEKAGKIVRKPLDFGRDPRHFKSHCVSKGFKKCGDFLDDYIIRAAAANTNLFKQYGYNDIQHCAPSNIALPTYCLFRSSREGDVVLDPFAGQGTLAYLAIKNNRRSISFELGTEMANTQEAMLNDVWNEIMAENHRRAA